MSPESHPPPTLGRVRETVDAIYRSDSRRILEWLREEVLEPVPHHHVVLTMPRLLRPLFRRRRELLLDLSQCGASALSEYMRREVGADARPGIVVSVATCTFS